MVGNIGCYMGCNNPVIGQCRGFQGDCGQFYCHAHSKGKLCHECDARKVETEKRQAEAAWLEAIRSEYAKTAGRVTKRAGGAPYVSAIIAVIIGLVAMKVHSVPSEGVAIFKSFTFFIALPCVVYIFVRHLAAIRSLDEAAKTRPGFRTYYESYLAAKEAEEAAWNTAMLKGLAGAILLGTIEGTVKGTGEAARRMVRDVTTPAESGVELRLNDIARKLDRK